MSLVVTRRTRARGAQLFRGSSRHRREAIASAAKAFWRSETHRGLPTGTIALRRRRVGLTTLAAVVDERAFGFAGDVAVAFRVRGSMFSLFSSSQLAYARCCWGLALVRFRPGLPFCGAHFLAASSGPMSTFVALLLRARAFFLPAHAQWAGNSPCAQLSSNDPLPARESVAFARLFGW